MDNAGLILALTLTTLFCNGCHQTAVGVVDPTEPTQAQPKLQTMKLYVGPEQLIAELALTPGQVQTGMMFRTNMADNTGMLFVLPYTQQARFWMKDCPLPLNAAYIDPDGVIQEIHDLHPQDTNTVFSASDNIRFVLETPQGWFKNHQIGTNVAVATELGSLAKVFLRHPGGFD